MNQSPSIQGNRVLLRKPIESDIYDYYNYDRDEEIERMSGKDTRNLKPLTLEEARSYINGFYEQKYKWCIEYEGRCIGKVGLKVNDIDCRARYSVGFFEKGHLLRGSFKQM